MAEAIINVITRHLLSTHRGSGHNCVDEVRRREANDHVSKKAETSTKKTAGVLDVSRKFSAILRSLSLCAYIDTIGACRDGKGSAFLFFPRGGVFQPQTSSAGATNQILRGEYADSRISMSLDLDDPSRLS